MSVIEGTRHSPWTETLIPHEKKLSDVLSAINKFRGGQEESEGKAQNADPGHRWRRLHRVGAGPHAAGAWPQRNRARYLLAGHHGAGRLLPLWELQSRARRRPRRASARRSAAARGRC